MKYFIAYQAVNRNGITITGNTVVRAVIEAESDIRKIEKLIKDEQPFLLNVVIINIVELRG